MAESRLKWSPAHKEVTELPDRLKHALRRTYGNPIDGHLNRGDILYLGGLVDAGIDEAEFLICALERWHNIDIFEEPT